MTSSCRRSSKLIIQMSEKKLWHRCCSSSSDLECGFVRFSYFTRSLALSQTHIFTKEIKITLSVCASRVRTFEFSKTTRPGTGSPQSTEQWAQMCSLTKAVKPLQIDWLGLLLALYSHAHQTVGRCSFLPTCPWTKPRCKQTRTHQNVKLAASVVCAFVLTLQGLKYYSCYFLLWCLRCWGSELFEKFFLQYCNIRYERQVKVIKLFNNISSVCS